MTRPQRLLLALVLALLIAPGCNALLAQAGTGIMYGLLLLATAIAVGLLMAVGPQMQPRREQPIIVQQVFIAAPPEVKAIAAPQPVLQAQVDEWVEGYYREVA